MKKILLMLLLLISVACTSVSTSKTPPLLKVTLKPIIDKASAQPVSTNIITCTWYSASGGIIKTEKYQDRESLELSVAGDGDTRLEILVYSQGYGPWTLGFQTKLKKDKVIITPVELTKNQVQE